MTKRVDYAVNKEPQLFAEISIDPSKLKIQSLTVTQMGYYANRTWQRKGGNFRNWAMLYISGGSGYYRCGDQPEQSVQTDSLFFVWPGETFHYGPKPGGSWNEYYITFKGNRVREWLSEGLISARWVSFVGHDKSIAHQIERMFPLMESGVPLNHDRCALILESILLECAAQTELSSSSALRRTEFDSLIIEAISENLFQPFHAETLAFKLHISLSTLRRYVKGFSGYSLNEYVHRLKIIEAKKLLLNTEINVKQLAYTLGYDDVHYFSRLFKKFAGVSPGLFRQTPNDFH
jgi:AraC-like DNA-binding protein